METIKVVGKQFDENSKVRWFVKEDGRTIKNHSTATGHYENKEDAMEAAKDWNKKLEDRGHETELKLDQ